MTSIFWEQISGLMEEMLRFIHPNGVFFWGDFWTINSIWSFFKDLIARFELIAGIYCISMYQVIQFLTFLSPIVEEGHDSPFQGVTFSTSQKGHQQNCQVVNLQFFFTQ